MHNDHRQIARGFVIVAIFVTIAKLAAGAKEIAVAWRYGISPVVDGYLFGYNLVQLPVSVFFSVMMVVLLPLAARFKTEDPLRLSRFRAELLGLTIGIGIISYCFAYWTLNQFAAWEISGLPGSARVTLTIMAPWLAALLPLGLLNGLWSSWIMAGGGHANSLFEGIPAIFILLVLILLPGNSGESLLWGTVGGFLAQSACLALPLTRNGRMEYPRLGFSSSLWEPFRIGFMTVFGAQILMSTSNVLDQFFAARLGEGVIATIGYSNRILALILGLGATAISRATLPVFSGLSQVDSVHRRNIVQHWVNLMLILGFVAAITGWLLSSWGVGVLFERGAFTHDDTNSVARVLCWSMLEVPWYMASLVLVADLNARRFYQIFIGVNAINLLAKCILLATLVPFLGVIGIPLATAGMYAISYASFRVVHHRISRT